MLGAFPSNGELADLQDENVDSLKSADVRDHEGPVAVSADIPSAAELRSQSERLIRENGIELPRSVAKKRPLQAFIQSVRRDHAAREQQRNKREAHEAIFVPKLTADPPSKAAISATSSGLQLLDDLMEDALECPVLVIEQPSVSPSLKILTQFHKKPCTLDVLNKDLKERSKSSVKAAPVESKQSPAIPGSDYDDDLDKTEIGYEVYSDLGSDEYADDNLLDAGAGSASEETFDEEEASDLESEAHKTHGIVLTDEEGDDVVLRRKHSVMPILDSDLDQPDRRAEDPTTNSSDEEEALLNLLSGEFAANLAESKSKSRFVDDEADEEDEMGNLVLNSADRNDDVDRQHLVQELRGMIDDKATSITDDTKKLYVQQLVEDDLNEANEMLTLLQSKKKRRAEEKTLRKLIKSRTTFKNTPFITSDTSNAPVSFNEFEEIFSFDKKDTGHVLDPTFVSETGGPMHPIQFSRSSHYVENTNLYSNIRGRAKLPNSMTVKPALLERTQKNMTRLQEIQLLPAKKVQTFTKVQK